MGPLVGKWLGQEGHVLGKGLISLALPTDSKQPEGSKKEDTAPAEASIMNF